MSSLTLDEARRADVAAHHQFLVVLREHEASGEWQADGAANFAGWLANRYQEPYAVTRQWIQDAHALASRPALDAAHAAGVISDGQMRAITVLARPESDDDAVWLEAVRTGEWPIGVLQREARKAKARELEKVDEGRHLSLKPSGDERYLLIRGQLPIDEGALFMKAVDRAVPDGVTWQSMDAWRARGLVEMAKLALRVGPDKDVRDRGSVVVYVDPTDTIAHTDTGGILPKTTAERLACDGREQTIACTACGYANTSRIVPDAMYRKLKERDVTCVFPGCERQRFCEAHHIVPRPIGQTKLANLVLTCDTHHRLVHEHGWRLAGQAGPHITWIRPDGTPLQRGSPAFADTS